MNRPTSSEVKLGDWISEGWRMFAEQWKAWVLHALISALVILVGIVPLFVVIFAMGGLAGAEAGTAVPVGIFFIAFVWVLLLNAVISVLMCGMYNCAFKQLRGGTIGLSDLFSAINKAPSVFLGSLAVGLLTTIGLLFCILPAFLVAGLFYFTIPLIVFEDMGVFDAMRASYDVTRPNIWMFTLFAFIVQLLAQAGSYACYVGLLVTYPLLFTIAAIAYRDCFGVPGARSFAAPSAPHAAPYSPQYPPQYPGQYPPQGQRPGQYPPTPYPPPPNPPTPPTQSPAPPPSTDFGSPVEETCKSCGASVPPNANFCPACGANPKSSL